jgi:hypothetical protein
VEFVKNVARAVLDVRCCYNSDRLIWQFRGELGSALCILDRRDTGSD